MNTHILIPIEYLTIRLKLLNEQNGDKNAVDILVQRNEARIDELNFMQQFAREISLDEKDIDEAAISQAQKVLPEYSSIGFAHKHFIEGYKQALKDLI